MSDKKGDEGSKDRRTFLEQNPKSKTGMTSRPELRKLMRMGRRRFLNRMAALGVSGTALSGLTKEAVAKNTDDPKKQVIRLFGERYKEDKHPKEVDVPERKRVYHSIPLDQYIRTQASRNAANRLAKEFRGAQYSFGVSSLDGRGCVVAKHMTYGSPNDDRSSNRPYEEFEDEVPRSVDETVIHDGTEYKEENIPVIQKRETLTEQDYFDDKYRPVPGGCEGERSEFWSNRWTLGLPAYSYEEWTDAMVTASHCVNRDDNVQIVQPQDGTEIGKSNQYTVEGDGDVATITTNSSTSIEYDIAAYTWTSNDYMGWNVIGTVSSDKLDDMAANSDYAYMQGATTGRDYQPVDEHFDKNKDSGPKVRIVSESDNGDSGGGYYIVDENDDVYRVGIHAWGSETEDGEEAASGNTFYYAENKFDLS